MKKTIEAMAAAVTVVEAKVQAERLVAPPKPGVVAGKIDRKHDRLTYSAEGGDGKLISDAAFEAAWLAILTDLGWSGKSALFTNSFGWSSKALAAINETRPVNDEVVLEFRCSPLERRADVLLRELALAYSRWAFRFAEQDVKASIAALWADGEPEMGLASFKGKSIGGNDTMITGKAPTIMVEVVCKGCDRIHKVAHHKVHLLGTEGNYLRCKVCDTAIRGTREQIAASKLVAAKLAAKKA